MPPPTEDPDAYVNENEIQEEVTEEFPAPQNVPQNEPDGDEEQIEIDMRNNSTTYFDQHIDSVYLIASHPTLPMVVSGGGDHVAYLWTTCHSPPRLAAKLTEHSESVIAGGFTANGKFLVTGDMSGRLIVWKSNSTGEKWSLMSNTQEVEEIVHISFHPELSMFAVSGNDGSIWCYEISDDVVNVSVLAAHSLPTTATTFVPSDRLEPKLFSVSEDGTVILWDVYSSRAEFILGSAQLRGEHPWVSLALSPTGKTVAVGSMDGLVALIKLADGMVLQMIDTTIVKPEPKPDSDDLAEKNIQEEGEEDNEEEDGRSIEGLAWSKKTNLLATGNVDGTVVIWNTQTWKPRSHFQLGDSVTKLEFVPDSSLLVVSSIDSSLLQYDVINSEEVWSCLGHNEGVLGFALQMNGSRIISASDDQVCLVFDRP